MNSLLKQQVLANRRKEDAHIQNGVTRDEYLKGAAIRHLSISESSEICYQSSIKSSHMILPYVMEGEMNVKYLDSGNSVKLNKLQNRLIYRPEYHIKVNYQARTGFKGMRVLLDESFLERYQSLIENDFPSLANCINSSKAFVSPRTASFTTINESQALHDIANCRFSGAIRKMYLESKIGELLALRFSDLKQERPLNTRRFRAEDYQKIRSLRAYLEESFHQKHSLNSLAREFGLNTFKLKKGFKELYHIPVYKFILTLRMSKAKRLLQEGKNVNEVSQETGYEHANYFSMAFKKYFGFSPGQLKK